MACRKALNRTGALEERCGVGARIYLVSAEEDTDSVTEKQNLSGVTMTQVNVKAFCLLTTWIQGCHLASLGLIVFS